MRHLGDITKINGAEIEPVDVITFGAPCQDLSVAGKRAGMKSTLMGDEENTRSGLFFESLRVIREMRERDEAARRSGELVRPARRSWIRPRFTVYENVAGAFSSNSGEDWAAVITESIRVVEPEAPDIPVPEKGWPKSGLVYGDGWSLAWTTHDSQFFGAPQRRTRASLVCDYGGYSASKVLALCHFADQPTASGSVQSLGEGVSGYIDPGSSEGKGVAGGTEDRPFAASRTTS